MSVEAVASIGAGIFASSLALVAFGSDSIVELLSSLVVSRHITDDAGGGGENGRGTSRLSSVLLLSIVPMIGAGAGYSYLSGTRPEGSLVGVTVAAASALIMPYLWLQKKRIGKETRCLPLQIDAIESATCFFMSLALLGGLLAEFLYGLWWADYLAAVMILAFVAKEGAESYSKSTSERSGRAL